MLFQSSDMFFVTSDFDIDWFKLVNQLFCNVLTCDLKLHHSVRKDVAFEHWSTVGVCLSWLYYEATYFTCWVHCESCRVHNLEWFDSELIEHNLSHPLSICLISEGAICHKQVYILCLEVEFVEDVLPDQLHVVPVSLVSAHDASFDWLWKSMCMFVLICSVTKLISFLFQLWIVDIAL